MYPIWAHCTIRGLGMIGTKVLYIKQYSDKPIFEHYILIIIAFPLSGMQIIYIFCFKILIKELCIHKSLILRKK